MLNANIKKRPSVSDCTDCLTGVLRLWGNVRSRLASSRNTRTWHLFDAVILFMSMRSSGFGY